MEKTQQAASHTHMTSTAAFVEGGIQEACVDACSICLEDFCESDPSTVTSCRHEFHLQCVLEWSQRSSQCPMCLQPISLKDPTSQELLEAVEQERNLRLAPSRSAVILHHPTLGDFELQHLPVSGNDSELEEHIIRHLAAAAAMGRTRHIRRREGHRNRSSSHARPQFLVFPPQPNAPSDGTVSASMSHVGRESEPSAITVANPSTPLLLGGAGPSYFASASEPSANSTDQQGFFFNNRSSDHASPPSQDRAGPSDFLSFSGSLKSRWSSLSMRYKESISKSTRGWKEKLFSQNASMTDVGAAVQREVKTGIASVSRMIEHLGIRESSECSKPSMPNQLADHAIVGHGNQTNQTDVERWNGSHLNDNNM